MHPFRPFSWAFFLLLFLSFPAFGNNSAPITSVREFSTSTDPLLEEIKTSKGVLLKEEEKLHASLRAIEQEVETKGFLHLEEGYLGLTPPPPVSWVGLQVSRADLAAMPVSGDAPDTNVTLPPFVRRDGEGSKANLFVTFQGDVEYAEDWELSLSRMEGSWGIARAAVTRVYTLRYRWGAVQFHRMVLTRPAFLDKGCSASLEALELSLDSGAEVFVGTLLGRKDLAVTLYFPQSGSAVLTPPNAAQGHQIDLKTHYEGETFRQTYQYATLLGSPMHITSIIKKLPLSEAPDAAREKTASAEWIKRLKPSGEKEDSFAKTWVEVPAHVRDLTVFFVCKDLGQMFFTYRDRDEDSNEEVFFGKIETLTLTDWQHRDLWCAWNKASERRWEDLFQQEKKYRTGLNFQDGGSRRGRGCSGTRLPGE